MEEDTDEALEYARRLHANIVDWYKTAETKAQIILSLDGIFASFLMATVITKRADAKEITDFFAWHTWLASALTTAALATSIGCSVMCLITRVMPRKEITRRYGATLRKRPPDGYPPEVLWYFQTISVLDERNYGEQALKVTADTEKGRVRWRGVGGGQR